MGSQGPGRKRTPNKNGLTAEEDALNIIAREAETRLAAKRAARAEAREIRMRELERQQKEIYQVQKKYYGLDIVDNKWGDIEQWMENSERYTHPSQKHGPMSDDEEQLSLGSSGSLQLCQTSSLYMNLKKKMKKKQSSKTSNDYDDDDDDDDYNTKSSRDSLDESFNSSSWHSSSHAPSEYSGILGTSSRNSSRVSSKCSSPVLDNRLDKDILEKVSSRASTLSTATLASLGETSSCRGSGDSSVTMNAELSLQEIKEIHELKDQIQDVETKYTQSLKDIKDSLAEMEEKYRKAMVSNAQLDNEKSNLMYQVDTLKDSLMELEELLAETRRDLEEKNKDLEREKHSHNILQFKFKELEETLKQSEELLTEIRQLRLRQDGFVREVSDLQETIEWKDKKIGALERQKEYSDAIRNERDELRDEVVHLRDILKRHGIVLGPDLSINKEEEEGEKWEKTDGSACIEVQEGSSVLGTQEMQLGRDENIGCCREGQDQHPEDLYHGVQESHLPPHTQGSSSERPLATQYDEHLGDYLNNDFHQIPNNVEKSQCVVFDPEAIMSTSQFKDEIIGGKEVLVKEGKVGELEHLTGPRTADQNESLVSINISEVLKVQSPGFTHYTCEVPLVSPGHEYQSAETVVLDTQSEKTEVQSREIDKNVKQTVSTSSKKKRKKKKSKQKQKQGCEEKECNLESQKKNENQLKLGSLEDITVNQNVIMNLDFEEKTQPVNDSVDSVKLQSLESRTVDLFLESDDKTKCTSEVKNEKEMAQVANVSVELATGNQISHLDEMKGELIRAVKNERATQRDIQHGCTIEVDSMDVKACFKDLCRNPLELNHSSAKTSPDSSLIYKQFQVMTALKHPGEEAPESKAEENLVECVLEESSSVMPSWFSVKTNEEIIGSKKNVQEKIKAWQKQECDVVCATSQEHTCINSGPQELMQAQDEYMEDIKMSQGKQQTKKEGSVTEDLLGEKEENIILQQQDIPEQEHLEMKDDEYNVQETEAWQKPECDVACAASQEHMYMNSGPQELMQTQDVGEHQEVQTYKEDIKMSQGEQQINKESFLTEDPLVKKEEHIIHQQQDLEMKDDEDSVGEETGAAHNQNLDKPLLDVVELGQVINSIVQGGSQNLGEQAVEVMTGMNEEDLRRGTKKENKKGKAKSKEDCKMS